MYLPFQKHVLSNCHLLGLFDLTFQMFYHFLGTDCVFPSVNRVDAKPINQKELLKYFKFMFLNCCKRESVLQLIGSCYKFNKVFVTIPLHCLFSKLNLML